MSRFKRACRWLAERPFLDRWRSRDRRRLLVIALVTAIMAIPLVGWVADSSMAVAIIALPATAMIVLLAGSTRFLADLPRARLDEWHVQQRDAAYAGVYWLGSLLGVGGGLAIAWSLDADVSEGLVEGVIVGVGLLIAVLPSLGIAWHLPDEVADEQ